MRELLSLELASGQRATISHSTRADGDLSPSTVDPAELTTRRSAAVDVGPWHAVHQVHGCDVRVIDESIAASHPDGPRPKADALATSEPGQVLVVHSGDCVPVGFIHESGAVGVAHAGWKGLQAGVLAAASDAVRTLAGDPNRTGVLHAAVGPHIHVSEYAFGADDLADLAEQFGDEIIGTTRAGEPGLDLTTATRRELERLGAIVDVVSPDCTAMLADHYWSYRSRAEAGRIALVAWIEPT